MPGVEILWIPFFTFLMVIYSTALSLWFGSLNMRFRDIQILLPFLVQSLFMLTPLAYPIESFPEEFRWFFIFNPMSGIIEGYRYALLGSGDPFQTYFLLSYCFIALVFVSGLYIFNIFQRKFADII